MSSPHLPPMPYSGHSSAPHLDPGVAARSDRVGVLDPEAVGARRRAALPWALALVTATLAGTYEGPGTVQQREAWIRMIANATGWWPEEQCDCPPGCAVRPGLPGGPAGPVCRGLRGLRCR